ncbi:MAG: aminoglycoside phosphotransferase family protein [Clostridia bacterium]|nr:aminoglycoside phosphotransferase family protein [Clostridia bacterium]
MQNYFLINEDFNKIIKSTLRTKTSSNVINKLSPISTGWTNIVYKVETDNGNYYFRFPRDIFWEKTIVKDFQFAQYIKGKTSFTTVDLQLDYDNNRPFSFHKEIPGTPLAEKMNNLTTTEILKISKQIAQFMFELHNINFENDNIFTIDNIGLNLNDFITELLDEHVSNVDKVFWKSNNFTMSPNDYCLVHGDLNSSNIILDDNNNISAIIDFGFGGYGNKYFDISRIIGRCPDSFKNNIVKSYEDLQNSKININKLDKNINIWSNIDQSYINYMRTIGIYE